MSYSNTSYILAHLIVIDEPFKPFTIILKTGERFRVNDRNQVFISYGYIQIEVPDIARTSEDIDDITEFGYADINDIDIDPDC